MSDRMVSDITVGNLSFVWDHFVFYTCSFFFPASIDREMGMPSWSLGDDVTAATRALVHSKTKHHKQQQQWQWLRCRGWGYSWHPGSTSEQICVAFNNCRMKTTPILTQRCFYSLIMCHVLTGFSNFTHLYISMTICDRLTYRKWFRIYLFISSSTAILYIQYSELEGWWEKLISFSWAIGSDYDIWVIVSDHNVYDVLSPAVVLFCVVHPSNSASSRKQVSVLLGMGVVPAGTCSQEFLVARDGQLMTTRPSQPCQSNLHGFSELPVTPSKPQLSRLLFPSKSTT